MSFKVKEETAGKIYIHFDLFSYCFDLHFLVPRREDWVLVYQESWCNGPIYKFGLGPFFLFLITEKDYTH